MKCEEVKDQLVLLAYGELSAEEQAELELHLHGCDSCEEEQAALLLFGAEMAQEQLPVVSPNLLTASRMRLDEALDEASQSTFWMRLRSTLVGSWQHLYAAPALATMLLGAGFLSGNLLTRYQVAHAPKPPVNQIRLTDEASATIGTVSGVVPTSDPDVVQVKYTQVVPTTFQGRIDDAPVRELLMLGAQKAADSDVREQSVGFLADECNHGHRCDFRDALLVSLRYDKSSAVRLRALNGLKHFIGEDQQVRDAVLESLMRDSSADVRTHAIAILEPVEGDSSVRQVLHTVSTQDENPYIRNASMQVLGNVNDLQ